jgi:Fibronectin type III domain
LQALQSVTLGWQQTADPNAVGYNIYYGPATHDYTNMISVGNVTSVTIGGLVEGATYYFAATTYNAQGQESGFSSEVVYVVPIVAATNMVAVVQLRSGSAGQFILTVTGPSGQSYDIQATQDFKAWTVIGTVTVGAGGSLDFTDTNAANFPQRFYRTQETP